MFYRTNANTSLLAAVLLLLVGFASNAVAQTPPRSPSDTVREFYKAMREKRFRDAFAMSVLSDAIEGLTSEQLEDLRPDFERMAFDIPENVEINGEQISGDSATVFLKVPKLNDPSGQPEPVSLMLANGVWIVGDKESQAVVKKAGNKYFFEARINIHQSEAKDMLQRISVAQLIYAQQHNGLFGDLAALTGAGLVPKDVEGTESTGYRYHLSLGKDAKSYTVGAEPAQYGRTGRLSFFMDQSGLRSTDNGGKPFVLKEPK